MRGFKHIESRDQIFNGKYLKLEKLKINLPDGRRGEREVVRVEDAAAVIPVDKNGKVQLVRQYRHAIEKDILEVPAGLINKGETPEQTAVRECEEETGFRPQRLKRLLYYAHAEGYSSGFTTLFLGLDLIYTGKINPDSTELLERVSLPFEQLLKKVKQGEILDSKTILCVLLYERMRYDIET